MDTDDLSREAYRAIITEAEKFNHDLTLHLGLLSDGCEDEQEYLDQSSELIQELKTAQTEELEVFFFGELPNMSRFRKTLEKISDNIAKVNQIPFSSRHFDF